MKQNTTRYIKIRQDKTRYDKIWQCIWQVEKIWEDLPRYDKNEKIQQNTTKYPTAFYDNNQI